MTARQGTAPRLMPGPGVLPRVRRPRSPDVKDGVLSGTPFARSYFELCLRSFRRWSRRSLLSRFFEAIGQNMLRVREGPTIW